MINLNIMSYLLYSLATLYIIYFLGKYFHKHGRVFILALYNNNVAEADATNNLLLTLYYLLNMGYTILQLYFWVPITSWMHLLGIISYKISLILMLLAGIHYINMLTIYLLSKSKTSSFSSSK